MRAPSQKNHISFRKQWPEAAYSAFLQNFSREEIALSKTSDQISDFTVELANPLQIYDTEFVDAYAARKQGDTTSIYYAIVFKDLNIPIRLAEIAILQKSPVQNMISPEAFGVTEISRYNAQKLVVIFKRPSGISLARFIKQEGRCKEQLLEDLIKKTGQVLSDLHERGILHGSINPHNIFIDDKKNITINECISSLCGFYQSNFYETPQRAQSNSYAKSLSDFSADYYALGMTIFSSYSKIIDPINELLYIVQQKLYGGTYNFLSQICIMTGKLNYIIRGLVYDDPLSRWHNEHIVKALKQKQYDVEQLDNTDFFEKPIKFADEDYYSRASLAFAMSKNWEAALDFIKTDRIHQWLLSNGIDLSTLFDVAQNATIKPSLSDEPSLLPANLKHSCILSILEPNAPIRLKNTSFYLKEMRNLLAIAHISNHAHERQYIDVIHNLLLNDFFKALDIIYSVPGSIYRSEDFDFINSCASYIKVRALGFGTTRCMYELNPYIPCRFFLERGKVIWNLRELMQRLEKPDINIKKISLNEEIICFMYAKLNIKKRLYVPEFGDFQILDSSSELALLVLCAKAQKQEEIKRLPSLCQQFAEHILSLLPRLLHSVTIKQKLSNAIKNSSKYGVCEYLLRIITRTKYFRNDAAEYQKANELHKQLTKQQEMYQSRHTNNSEAYLRGVDIVLRIGYIAFIASLFMIALELIKV